jgi:dTDP-4-dehydrorhamnose reductase
MEYVKEVVRRYPHITWFTPVNEPFVTSWYSSKDGIWNEGQTNAEGYVRATANVARAAVLAKQVIRQIWQDEQRPGEPIFLQNDSFEVAILGEFSSRRNEVELFNSCYRFSALDLIFGHRDSLMQDYFLSRGMTKDEYEWFMENGDPRQTILGIDHYPWCVHDFHEDWIFHHDRRTPYRLYDLIKEYWKRYPLPLMHAEVNAWPEEALQICQETYDHLTRLVAEGYPVAGMAWYGDESQMDWHNGLRTFNEETPVGLFRNGKPQEVARLFCALAQRGLKTERVKEVA